MLVAIRFQNGNDFARREIDRNSAGLAGVGRSGARAHRDERRRCARRCEERVIHPPQTGSNDESSEAERRRWEQARQSFEREEAATAKEREALRRERKQWEQAGAECDVLLPAAQPVGWHQSRRFVRCFLAHSRP